MYNGWTNWETWCVHLWLTNDELSYRYWQSLEKEMPVERMAEEIKEEIFCGRPDISVSLGGLYDDLLDSALENVNWYEIASAFMPEGSK